MTQNFKGIDPETGQPWSPVKVARLMGLRAVNDPQEIEALCVKVLGSNSEQVALYRSGKTKVLGGLIKQVMDASRNGANPDLTRDALVRLMSV